MSLQTTMKTNIITDFQTNNMETTKNKIYIYTNETYRLKGWYKVGATTLESAQDRIDQQDGTACAEPLIKVWESEFVTLWDDKVREVLFNQGLIKVRTDKHREWVTNPVGSHTLTDSSITLSVVEAINTLQKRGGLKIYRPWPTQMEATNSFFEQLDKALEGDASSVRGVSDLCARFGKSPWTLDIFSRLNIEYGYSTLLLPAYWLSAHASFEKEIREFRDFNHFSFIDTSSPGWEDKLISCINAGIPRVISLSLCGDATDRRLERFVPIKKIPQDEVFLFCDESDVGAHTIRSEKVLNYVFPMEVV